MIAPERLEFLIPVSATLAYDPAKIPAGVATRHCDLRRTGISRAVERLSSIAVDESSAVVSGEALQLGALFATALVGRVATTVAITPWQIAVRRGQTGQYVLSYPFRIRLALARSAHGATRSRRILLEEVSRFQRRLARRQGVRKPKTGAVVMTQRFGSRLNANLHHYSVFPDGVFSEDGNAVTFVRIAEPSEEELARILARIIRRTSRMLSSMGL